MSLKEKNETEGALLELISALKGSNKTHVAKVVRHGEELIIPKGMTTADAIKTLERQLKYDNEPVAMNFDFPYFVWDGAYALSQVMEKRYGFVFGEVEQSFFGDEPPALMGIEVERGKVVQVPWGNFTAPSIKGARFSCGFQIKEGKLNFRLTVTCKHMHEPEVKSLRDEVEAFLEKHSIYKGKAISIRFTDDSGKELIGKGIVPTPMFLDLSKAVEQDLVFSKPVDDAIKTNLFTVLEYPDRVRKAKIPLKRGILLAGDFGTGKTLTAYVAAQKALKSNITYIYCQKPSEFASVMRFAIQYTPALVFCEDVDRIIALKRDEDVNELINIIDGVETKNAEIITVFTSNIVKDVNPALLRPGRMDAVIHVSKPDSEAVQQLIRNYAGKFLEKDANLSAVGVLLAGNIPSIVREVCERAKLSALRMLPKSQDLDKIPVEALLEAASTMKMQLELLSNRSIAPKEPSVLATEAIALGLEHLADAVAGRIFGLTENGEEKKLAA